MSTRNVRGKSHDQKVAGGFVLWIVVYAVFMLGLIALNTGGNRLVTEAVDRTVVADTR